MADVHTGAMIALVPTDADAARLAVPGGEPTDQLHVTLRYLGEADAFDDDARADLVDLTREYVAGLGPIEANLFGLAMFNPDGDEPCVVGLIGGDAVWSAYQRCGGAVEDHGAVLPPPLLPYTAHLTLEYTDDPSRVADLIDLVGPVRFDRVRLAFGGQNTDIPLSGPPRELAAPPAAAAESRAIQLWLLAEHAL